MGYVLRVRLASFFGGAAVASFLGLYILHNDYKVGHQTISQQIEEPDDETEHLQQPENDPYQDIKTSYVTQICLSWEALHCQYTQLNQLITCQPDNPNCYNHSAQQFQQFQVLLQRFIENEPFEEGHRAEIYARTQRHLPKLLQVPDIQSPVIKGTEEEESDYMVHAPDLIKIIETSILTFQLFVKMDKKKTSSVLNLFGNQNQAATLLQQIQSSLEKGSYFLLLTDKVGTGISINGFSLYHLKLETPQVADTHKARQC